MLTVAPVVRFVSIAYWSHAESIIRRSFRMRLACERLRARRKPGTAMAASRAMMATTIMISTRVNPLWDFAADIFIYIEKEYQPTCQYIDHRCFVGRNPTSNHDVIHECRRLRSLSRTSLPGAQIP